MKYKKIIKGKFISRPNRFVAHVEINGEEKICHVKNTGRCAELLVPDATVYLEDFTGRMGTRKLAYSLIAVEKKLSPCRMQTDSSDHLLINMDSQAPNVVAREALASGTITLPGMSRLIEIKPEVTFGNSRLDFFVKDVDGREGYVEVKGVTLETGGIALFPDAPTERGIKHLRELTGIKKSGLAAFVLFVVQMSGMKVFCPNDERHPAFGDALREAHSAGVGILAYECTVTPDSLQITKPVQINLHR